MSNVGPTEPRRPASRPRGERARQVAGVVALGLTVAFCVLNTQRVKIDWIVTTTHTPLIVALVVSAVLGMIAAYLLAFLRRRRRRY